MKGVVLGAGDDPTVVEFLILFQKLRTIIDDDPVGLEEWAETDESLRSLCIQVADAAMVLSAAEDKATFISPVNPSFTTAWRIYEERYSAPLAGIWLGFDLGISPPKTEDAKLQVRWENADYQAIENSSALEGAFDIVADDDLLDDDFRLRFEGGLEDWNRLKNAGFSLRGAFRRRDLVPVVHIPRHVSNHYNGERGALYALLRQAQDAFVFGVPYASIALMRAILELVLLKHYKVELSASDGKAKLADLINSADLPKSISRASLRQLKGLANDVLHSNAEVSLRDDIVSEINILSWLVVVRTVIENAPTTSKDGRARG